MTEEKSPVERIASLYALFGEGRLEETFDLMDPAVVLHEPGDPSVLPWAGRHVGHAGVREFYEGLRSGLSDIAIDPETLELRAIGDGTVLALGTERGVSAATGRSYETRSAWVWTLRNGRIVELRAFHDTAAMCSAFAE